MLKKNFYDTIFEEINRKEKGFTLKKEMLCFYNQQSDETNFEVLQDVLEGYRIKPTLLLDEAKELFEKNHYSVVLIDFTKEEGKEFLNFVLCAKIEQKIITMSDNFECSELLGCNFCIEHHKRKRIFRPINLKELVDVIHNFEKQSCTYMHKINNIVGLLDKIVNEFNRFCYDANIKRIYPLKGIAESYLIEEILEITSLLQDNHIKFQVDEHYNINLFIA